MDFDPKLAVELADGHFPDFIESQRNLDRLDRWWRWDHDKPHAPRTSTKEYRELANRAQTPWLSLVVKAIAQTMYVEGFRPSVPLAENDPGPWRWWQANGMDARQIPIHYAALGYGVAFTRVEAGVDFTGQPLPVIRGFSPRRMMAFYDDAAVDEWPMFALQVDLKKLTDPKTAQTDTGWEIRLWGDTESHLLHKYNDSTPARWITSSSHGATVCPIVRYTNALDLEGRTPGEVEPYISVAARIDQTTFDRLVVQRFSSWVVRTIAGMAKPEGDDAEAARLRLKVEDLLIAADPDTKFGSLPATPLDGFLKAKEADTHDLAAVSQTPPHNLLGQMVNLSADALAAAETSATRKAHERKTSMGEAHEQTLRLAGSIAGDMVAARDIGGQVRWRDMESRSLAQVTDALGKQAQMLGVPPEALWGRIPGVTDQDVAEWKALLDERTGRGVDGLMIDLLNNEGSSSGDEAAAIKAKADAMGVLIRSGVDPVSAAAKVGLDGVEFTGAVPVSLRLPESDASGLEQQ